MENEFKESQHLSLSGLVAGGCDLKSVSVRYSSDAPDPFVELEIRFLDKNKKECVSSGRGKDLFEAISSAVGSLCTNRVEIEFEQNVLENGQLQWIAFCRGVGEDRAKTGIGKSVSQHSIAGATHAAFKAVNHAGQLKAPFRTNHQKQLRQLASQTVAEIESVLNWEGASERQKMEAEHIVLDSLNRAASAAVIVASNHPRRDSILSLYDTSSWLYDSHGHKREAFLETDHWLAWYPGLNNDSLIVGDVVRSMPAAAAAKIPWIVRLLENPESIIRFRGAVSLADHDILHVLLGRGLQDQDEAFVIGFAMGTAKKPSPLQRRILKFVLSRLYPEPYRIPAELLSAFDLGIQCGRETGRKDLYKRNFDPLTAMTIRQARTECEIDTSVLKRYFRAEQLRIPMTIASVRLPTEP